MAAPDVAEIVVVRHGETQWNVEGRVQGHLDSPLTERGLRQAEAIAESFAGERIDLLLTSDLPRAARTAEAIGRRTGVPVTPEPRLRERHFGVFQGLTHAQMRESYPEAYRRWHDGEVDFAIPGGETRREGYRRVADWAADAVARYAGRRVVAVAHGGTLDYLFRYVLGLPLEAPRTWSLLNAGRNTFTIENGTWRLVSWGDVHHLRRLPTAEDLTYA